MVNIVTIAFVHAILFLAAFRLMMRDDLDQDAPIDSDEHGDGGNGADGQKPLSPSERRRARLRESRQ